MTEDKKLDRRVVRTRQRLRSALFELILEEGFDRLTIKQITDRADLNHATFYLHYRDKQELLMRSMEEVFQDLVARINEADMGSFSPDQPPLPLILVFEHVRDYADFYRVMIDDRSGTAFMEQLRSTIAEISLGRIQQMRALVDGKPSSVSDELSANYAAGALVGVVAWWVKGDMQQDPADLALQIGGIIMRGLYASLGLIR
ncbi:MAG: TetR/AcrR family transcriptional regulator [Chloroflexi bacterium]|nr:TetR/AcrR family transcriptional regulator [Chloroflexota bacterium]